MLFLLKFYIVVNVVAPSAVVVNIVDAGAVVEVGVIAFAVVVNVAVRLFIN